MAQSSSQWGQFYAISNPQDRSAEVLIAVRRWAASWPWRWLFPRALRLEINEALLIHDMRQARELSTAEIIRSAQTNQWSNAK